VRIRDVPNGAGEHSRVAFYRTQADLGGKLRAVLAQGEQIGTDAHGRGSQASGQTATIRDVPLAEALRQQTFDGLARNRARRVAEEREDLMIREPECFNREEFVWLSPADHAMGADSSQSGRRPERG
jgi:hypothetical protein